MAIAAFFYYTGIVNRNVKNKERLSYLPGVPKRLDAKPWN